MKWLARYKKIAVLMALLLVLGFGCKGLSEEEKASVKPIKLTYWTVFNDVDQLRAFADEYKIARPYVTIDIRQVRYNEFDNLFTNALADGVGPDIVSMHTRWLGRYRQRLSPMPSQVTTSRLVLKNKLNKEIQVIPETFDMPSPATISSNYVQSIAEGVQSGGVTYGLPLAMDTMAIYYNKDLLDLSGIPEPPKTWDDFLAASEKVTKINSSGDIVQSGVALGTGDNIENSFDILSLLMMQNGVEMVRGGSIGFSGGLRKADYSHPSLQALRFYTDFANPSKEAYAWNDKQGDAFSAFIRGQSAFYFGYAFDRNRILSRAPGMKLEVIPVPQLNNNRPVNVANFWIEGVTNNAQHKNEAWDFVRFMTNGANVITYVKKTAQPSPYRNHIEGQSEIAELKPFVSQILFAKNWYNGRDIDAAENAMDDLVENFLEPYGAKEKPLERDKNLLINAARVVQQTM